VFAVVKLWLFLYHFRTRRLAR